MKKGIHPTFYTTRRLPARAAIPGSPAQPARSSAPKFAPAATRSTPVSRLASWTPKARLTASTANCRLARAMWIRKNPATIRAPAWTARWPKPIWVPGRWTPSPKPASPPWGSSSPNLEQGDDAILAVDGFGRKGLIDTKKALRALGYVLPTAAAEEPQASLTAQPA